MPIRILMRDSDQPQCLLQRCPCLQGRHIAADRAAGCQMRGDVNGVLLLRSLHAELVSTYSRGVRAGALRC